MFTAVTMALIVAVLKWRKWQKASDARCCGGRCGCRVSRKKKKLRQKVNH